MTTNPPSLDERIDTLIQNIEDYCVMGILGGSPFNSDEENDALRENAVADGRKQAKQEIKALVADERKKLLDGKPYSECVVCGYIPLTSDQAKNHFTYGKGGCEDRLTALTSVTLHDVVTSTPKGQSAAQHAMEESIKAQNEMSEKPEREIS